VRSFPDKEILLLGLCSDVFISAPVFWSIFKSLPKRKETNHASHSEKNRDSKKQMHAHREKSNKTLKTVSQ